MQEFCNGGSLRQALQKAYFSVAKLPLRWPVITGVLRGIAEGMAYVHSKRICHGDLNPNNVLLKVRLRLCLLLQTSVVTAGLGPSSVRRARVPPGMTGSPCNPQHA